MSCLPRIYCGSPVLYFQLKMKLRKLDESNDTQLFLWSLLCSKSDHKKSCVPLNSSSFWSLYFTSILANTVRPSVDRRSDSTTFRAGTFSCQDLVVHSQKAGPGEVMTVENSFIGTWLGSNELFLTAGILQTETTYTEKKLFQLKTIDSA